MRTVYNTAACTYTKIHDTRPDALTRMIKDTEDISRQNRGGREVITDEECVRARVYVWCIRGKGGMRAVYRVAELHRGGEVGPRD